MSLNPARRSMLFVITSLCQGGAQKQMTEVALRLAARGWPVKGVISLGPLAHYADVLERAGVPVFSMGIEKKVRDIGALFRMADLVGSLRPDVMITFLFHASALGALVGRACGVSRIVASVRSQRLGGELRDWIFRWSEGLWDTAVVNSSEVALELVARGTVRPERLQVIPNGVELPPAATRSSRSIRAELGIPAGAFVWLAVGSVLPAKGYESLLKAVQTLNSRDIVLLVAGDGPLLPALEDMREQLGLSRKVRFLGERNDVHQLLQACDGFVNASAWEGMPNAVMEALAAGRAVLASRVGGVPELIEDGRTGWLVAPGDPAELAAAMARIMNLPIDARTMVGERGRASIVDQYGWERVISRWEKLLAVV